MFVEVAEPEIVDAARSDVVGNEEPMGEIIVLIGTAADEERAGRVVAAGFR